jgi:glycerol uptake facilitator protein
VFLGCGVVHASVLTGAQSGLWQVAIVWGVAIMLAVYTIGAISGAHINPAVTLAFAVWGRFSWRSVGPYIASQTAGAFVAAATLYVLFSPYLRLREEAKNVVRGQPGSEITAMCYGEYFPSPGPLSNAEGPYQVDRHERFNKLVSEPAACLAEFLGTLVLSLVVFGVADQRNPAAPPAGLAPVFIGLCVAALISLIAPLTQACFNPARDFGPRLFAFFAGWGSIALPGPRGAGFLTVYILSPIAGAIAGAGLYLHVLRAAEPAPSR